MGEKITSQHHRPPMLVPVPVENSPKRKPPAQEVSWWTFCARWLHYQSIQLRWDIERWLARLLHRRWGA